MSDDFFNEHLPDDLPDDPLPYVQAWLDHATSNSVQPNPNAMTLSTVDADGQPSSRVVLCKRLDAESGCFVFYTNYTSRKVEELLDNRRVCLNFHWDTLGRQVRVEGDAVKSPPEESDAYFASRHPGSQLGAWTSDQSKPLDSRESLERQFRERADALGVTLNDSGAPVDGSVIPRPAHWGGIRVYARVVELWVDGQHRIHDRGRWERELVVQDDAHARFGAWSSVRLQP